MQQNIFSLKNIPATLNIFSISSLIISCLLKNYICSVCPDSISTLEGGNGSGRGQSGNRHWQLYESSTFTAGRNACCSIWGTNDFMATSKFLHRPELPHQPERKNTTGCLQEPELGIPGMCCGNVQTLFSITECVKLQVGTARIWEYSCTVAPRQVPEAPYKFQDQSK